jgi:hypothetical protein
MPHWDEGRLQAWIDGPRSGLGADERAEIAEHVASCEACAAQAAELRASSDRAAAMLGSAGLEDMPPFAAVLERSHASGGGPGPDGAREPGDADDPGTGSASRPAGASPLARRWSATRWAASIVVALGAGWLANDLFRRGAVPTGPAAESAAVRALDLEEEAGTPDIEIPAPPEGDATLDAAGGVRPSTEAAEAEALATTVTAEAIEPPMSAPTAALSATADAAPTSGAVPPPDAARTTEPGALPPTPLDTRIRQADTVASAARATAAPEAAARERPIDDEAGMRTLGLLRGRVVDASSGRPLASAQVSVPELRAGALSRADGSFVLDLRDQPLDSVDRDLTVEAQLIGYGGATRRLDLASVDSTPLEFALESAALSLDELVVAGVAESAEGGRAAVPVELDFSASDGWPVVLDASGAPDLGPETGTLPGLDVVAVRSAPVAGVEVTRVEQRLADGTPVTLFHAARPLAIRNLQSGANVAQRAVADGWVTAVAAMDESELQDWLDRMR